MKKSLMRAALVGCLPFFAMALTVATTPAQAADKEKADAPKVSKSVAKQLADCKKAVDAKDYATAIAKCNEAKAVADTTDYDKYLANRFIGVAYFATNDRVHAEESFVAVLKNPACPPDDRQNLLGPAISLASEANNNALVFEIAAIALKDKITNPDIYGTIAQSYYQTNDNQNAILYAQKGIDLATEQNKLPQYPMLQILTFSYDKMKDRPNEVKGLGMMASYYGKAEDWKNVIDMSISFLPQSNKTAAEIAILDIYRLRQIVNVDWTANDYVLAASAADSIRSWGDKLNFLNLGASKGVLDTKKYGQEISVTRTNANKDQPILPQVEKTAKDSKALANVAEAYYGYDKYAEAAEAAQKAIAAGGVGVAEAKLVLAMAQIKKGDEAGAKATLAGFTGDPALVRAAELLGVYLNRRYGAAAPAAAH